MRTRSTIFLCLVAAACSARPTDESTTGGSESPLLPDASGVLAGRDVAAATDGPWLVRSAQGGAAHKDGSGAITTEAVRLAADDAPGVDARAVDLESRDRDAVEALVDAPPASEPSGMVASDTTGYTPMRAGSTDDNADPTAFLAFLDDRRQRHDLDGRWHDLDVANARTVRVVDADGAPLAGVEVRMIDEAADRIAWRGTTYGDGRIPFYPRLAGTAGEGAGPFLIEVRAGKTTFRQHWDAKSAECTVTMRESVERPRETVLDVVFVIDTTGSMGDEIDRIKGTLLAVTERLRSLEREFDLRYGAVLYRDVGDEYLTKTHPFTGDLAAFDKALQQIEANGGGDTPESLNQGLAVAVDGMDWRPGAAHLMFLIADAPPHMDYDGDIAYDASLRRAVARGIRIHAVAASGLDEAGSVVFRQIAQFTRGEFVFIEYGGDPAGSAEKHGVTGPVSSNNLDEILFARIRDEIAHWAVPAPKVGSAAGGAGPVHRR